MDIAVAIAIWLGIVVVSMAITVYLAHRWGHDPFGWVLLSAVLGPIAIVALIGTRQRDTEQASARETRAAAGMGAIVLAADGSEAAARIARHVAEGPDSGRDVVVLAVLPHEMEADKEQAKLQADRATAEALKILRDRGLEATVEVRFGAPGEEVVRVANEVDASVILVGRRGAGVTRALLGSVSSYVVAHADRPVTVVG